MNLLFHSCPFAIIRRIWTVIVDSFKRQPFRSFSHIGQEMLEMVPTLTHGYATAAVVFILFVIGVPAAIAHGRPNHVERVFFESVSSPTSARHLTAQASTTLFVSESKAVRVAIAYAPAIATTLPHHASTLSSLCGTKSDQAMKSLTGYIVPDATASNSTHVYNHMTERSGIQAIFERLKKNGFAESALAVECLV